MKGSYIRGVVVFGKVFGVFDLRPGIFFAGFVVRAWMLGDSAGAHSSIHFLTGAQSFSFYSVVNLLLNLFQSIVQGA